MTSRTLILTFLLSTLILLSHGQNITSLLNALVAFSVRYEYDQASAANQSYYAYSGSNLESYFQQGQHGNSTKAENISVAASYVMDLALLTNAEDGTALHYDGQDAFNNFVDLTQDFVCPTINCENSAIYRTLDGTCNNLANPLWGSAFTAQDRSKNLRGSWQRTSLIDYELNELPGFLFDSQYIGATPRFEELPFIFKVQGNSPFRISVFSTQNAPIFRSSDSVQCTGSPCRGTVPGAIYFINQPSNCLRNIDVLFKEGTNTFEVVTDSCKSKTYTVRYYNYLANVILVPEGGSTQNKLIIGDDVTVTPSDESPDNKFGVNEFTRYWMKIGSDQTIKITSGTEYSHNDIFLDGSLGLTTAPSLNRLLVAVGLHDTGVTSPSVSVQFVNRDIHEITTDGNTPILDGYGYIEDLNTIEFTYNYYVFRWGVKTTGGFTVKLTSNDDTIISLFVNLSNKTTSDLSYSGSAQQEQADYTTLQSVNFRTAAGRNFNSYSSYYLVWHDNYMYFGYGNQIGKNLITTQALEMNDLTRFVVQNVTLASDKDADWVIDIEQINIPRTTSLSTGENLATAVDVGMHAHSNENQETSFSSEVTLATFQYGQFIDHVFIATALSSAEGHPPVCCNSGSFVTDSSYSEEFCFEIPINNDILTDAELGPFATNNGALECMDFVRSGITLPCDGNTSDFRIRQNINVVTTYIDSSNVYGSSDAEADSLRDPDTAELKVQSNPFNQQDEMPKATSAGEACAVAGVTQDLTVNGVTKSVTVDCNHAGDFRSQEQSSLAGMHTLWVREHNRIVRELRLNGGYDDSTTAGREELFQVARHILTGMMQVVTYHHWLPSFLSNATLDEYDLTRKSCNYNPNKRGIMKNLFGIAFRMGHTWIPNDLAGNLDTTIHLDSYTSIPLNNNYFNATPSYEHGSDHVLNNLIKACPNTDRIMEDSVVKELFGNLDGDLTNVALNLAALNVQRGRDHGVPTYKEILELFENDPELVPQSIDEIGPGGMNLVNTETFNRLKRLYHSIEDIDAFTAAVSEGPMDSTTSVGTVINEVLGDMFDNMRRGDRFWYACYFRGQAKKAIENATLGRIMCDNIESFNDSQADVFRVEDSSSNPAVSCNDRPIVDLRHFYKSNNGGRNLNRFPNPTTTTTTTTSAPAASSQRSLLNDLVDFLDRMLNDENQDS